MTTGRPTKFTPAMREGILKALRAGNTRTAAAGAMGVNRATLWEWTKDNPTFLDDVEKAEAEAEQDAVDAIKSHFTDQWTSAAWYLERKHPDNWGKRERMDVTSGGERITFTLNLGRGADDGDGEDS